MGYILIIQQCYDHINNIHGKLEYSKDNLNKNKAANHWLMYIETINILCKFTNVQRTGNCYFILKQFLKVCHILHHRDTAYMPSSFIYTFNSWSSNVQTCTTCLWMVTMLFGGVIVLGRSVYRSCYRADIDKLCKENEWSDSWTWYDRIAVCEMVISDPNLCRREVADDAVNVLQFYSSTVR